MLKPIALAATLAAAATAATAEPAPSRYAGQEARAIKSLSAQDIDDLRNGRGWGLARAAELNGIPGPAHLLNLADEIGLDAAQRAQLEALKADMSARAAAQGERLIALESDLDRRFAARTITDGELRELLRQIGDTYRELRYIHLATHFETPRLLAAHQIAAYNRLRGYAPSGQGSDGAHDMSGSGHGAQ